MRRPSGTDFDPGLYHLNTFFIGTAVLSGDLFALKNGSSKYLVFRKFNLTSWFTQADVLGVNQGWTIRRFTGAAATGGSAIAITKSDVTMSNTTIADVRVAAGAGPVLVAPGTIEANPLIQPVFARLKGYQHVISLMDGELVIAPSEGIVLNVLGNTASGDSWYLDAAFEET